MKWHFVVGTFIVGLLTACQHATNHSMDSSTAVIELSYESRMYRPGRSFLVFSSGKAVTNTHGTANQIEIDADEIAAVLDELRNSGFFSFRQEDAQEELDQLWKSQNPNSESRPPVVVLDGSTMVLSVRWAGSSNSVVWTDLQTYLREWPTSTNIQKLNRWVSLVENLKPHEM